MEGGSGGNHSQSPFHPLQMPYKFETGTMNTTCIAGLHGALCYLEKHSIRKIAKQTMELAEYAWNRLVQLDDIILYGTGDFSKKVPTISFNLHRILPSELAYLYSNEGICIRSGIQCAPLAHKTIKTLPTGTVRISFSHYNTMEEVDRFVERTKSIIMEQRYGKTCA